ncbi:hypothetical protein IE077_000981 [Cardiosporidium cionae]|uniref:Uncharacterized protein n=1 Tax=Cardiosporidium cionae TaxID=476202 RepID=A0ABQ7JGC5_9APIC|nr:hypothetical protein IE077_000981 [Cardiosporidium cionae]|eukprot:KAF8823059.1 hypothetical protein IE077_000981 [Cardiosporidium cionae]
MENDPGNFVDSMKTSEIVSTVDSEPQSKAPFPATKNSYVAEKQPKDITSHYFESSAVGSTFGSTKRKYIWEIKVNQKPYRIIFFHSLLSRKKKLVVNDEAIHTSIWRRGVPFYYKWAVDGCDLSISLGGDGCYGLKIDGFDFLDFLRGEDEKNVNDETQSSNLDNPEEILSAEKETEMDNVASMENLLDFEFNNPDEVDNKATIGSNATANLNIADLIWDLPTVDPFHAPSESLVDVQTNDTPSFPLTTDAFS